MNVQHTQNFLQQHEPAAFEIVNAQGSSHVVLICDHASNRVPNCLGSLGLEPAQLADHIGWDPGAADVARLLSQKLDAPLVLSSYSRLVIDCNRPLQSHESIPEQSAGIIIPGNQHLSQQERENRIQHLFQPYHQAINTLLHNRLQNSSSQHASILLSIHSFTPFLFNQQRPWHIGISHKNNSHLTTLLFNALKAQGDITVGFNQPYPIEDEFDYSIPTHGDARNLPSAMIEIRQDGLTNTADIEAWATRITNAYQCIQYDNNC